MLQQALALYESEGVGYEQVISVVHLGEAYLLADRVEDARAGNVARKSMRGGSAVRSPPSRVQARSPRPKSSTVRR